MSKPVIGWYRLRSGAPFYGTVPFGAEQITAEEAAAYVPPAPETAELEPLVVPSREPKRSRAKTRKQAVDASQDVGTVDTEVAGGQLPPETLEIGTAPVGVDAPAEGLDGEQKVVGQDEGL